MFYQINAEIIHIPKATSSVTIDPVTGRPVFDTSAVVPERLAVSLEQRDTEPGTKNQAGKDIQGIYCSGRIMPIGTPIPDWLTTDGVFDIEWLGGRSGKLYLYSSVTSRFGLQNTFGERIQGMFYEPSSST